MAHEQAFPFRTLFSLRLLVEYWEDAIRSGTVPFGEPLLEQINQVPELREPVMDPAIIEKHRDLINFLMSAVIAPALTDKELTVATVPFDFTPVYETHAFRKNIHLPDLASSATINIPGHDMISGRTIRACLMILQRFYKVRLPFDKPLLFTVPNQKNGLDRVYKADLSGQFCEIVARTEVPPIDPRIIKFLTEKVYDVDLWLQYIRPEHFEFRGFMVLHLTDVTEQEMVSSIKYDLLEKDAITRNESFTAIEHKIRSIFNMPEIRLGLAYVDEEHKIIFSNNHDGSADWKSLAEQDSEGKPCDDYRGSVYERGWMEKRYIAVDDLETYPYKSKAEEILLSKGVRSILLAPLIDGDETIGMLELASPRTGELNSVSANKVESVIPMFTAAVKRVREESITQIRALIQEECTNIHPVVQWRFVDAGKRVLEKRRRGQPATFEEITFKNVHPLFGMADVRNSSLQRMLAIQEDLSENLNLAKALLERIRAETPLPILDELLFRTQFQLEKTASALGAGDESSTLDFLRREVHPMLAHFHGNERFRSDIERYHAMLDPVFGMVYRRRRNFEQSLSMINQMVGNHINEAQVTAQQMFPHYFEKYQTDGIEYTMYVGDSLVRDRPFDPLHLKNFRLWQLLLACEIEKGMQALKPRLLVPLDITQLILVHDQPLAIRFRPDEKQFDVDGAYDIRYEIIKKRIDKATVKHTQERLTQPGKIAVIYTQPKVRAEYLRYFDYLIEKRFLENNIEEFELDELPGATGLRALRVETRQTRTPDTDKSESFIDEMDTALHLQE